MAKQCEMIIGYLLPRRCEEKAITVCQKCKRRVCELHTRVADDGLLCRDCHEEGQPRTAEAVAPLPEAVEQTIYHRGGSSALDTTDDDFALFDQDEGAEGFSMLS
jgi:hypothetical protein